MQMLFLNTSSTSAQSTTTTSEMKQLILVSGFDMTIYSNNDKVLWQKTGFENVSLTNGGYIGGITIQLNNIKPSPVPIGTAIPLLSSSNNNSNSAILGATNYKW
jgi:hypothetical protein